jgi:uncharacterized protein YciI
MLYVIIGHDVPESGEARSAARPDHLSRLRELEAQGRLILAGPTPTIDSPDPGPAGMSGSVIVAEFESLEAAKEWAQADPYVAGGVFSSTEVRPFIKVLP